MAQAPDVARYLPDRPLPPYAFEPGVHPHPTRDPDGHSYGAVDPDVCPPPERWRDTEPYLWGADLYNAGYFWEAHEAWEGLWRACGDPIQRAFLQGLIQCAAAAVQARAGKWDAAISIAGRGLPRLSAAPAPVYMGVAVAPFCRATRNYLGARSLADRPSLALSFGHL